MLKVQNDPIERDQIFRSEVSQELVRVLERSLGWDERWMIRVEHQDKSVTLWDEKIFRDEHIRTYAKWIW